MSEDFYNSDIEAMRPNPDLETQITAGLDAFKLAIDDAPANVVPPATPGGYPKIPYPQLGSEIRAALAEGGYDAALFSRYVELEIEAERVTKGLAGSPDQSSTVLGSLAEYDFSPQLVREMFTAEADKGGMHLAAREGLAKANAQAPGVSGSNELKFLEGVYATERPTDLLRKSDNPYRTEIRKELLGGATMEQLYFREVASKESIGSTVEKSEHQAGIRKWMRDVVLTASDIVDPDLADEYIYAASRTVGATVKVVGEIIQKMDTLGTKKMAAIREFAGITSLQDYSLKQLERMASLALGDPKEIERLKNRDVTVAFTNRAGDDKGVLVRVPEVVDSEDEGTAIFFEIQELNDIYRFSKKIAKLGIRPSSVVFAAHGAPGEFVVTPKPAMASAKTLGQRAVVHAVGATHMANLQVKRENLEESKYHSVSGMAYATELLVSDYMQPSRGVDDPDKGKKKIAFITCNSATERQAATLDPKTGEPSYEKQLASVASKVATNIAKSGKHWGVEVYGGANVIQVRRTKTGFKYVIPATPTTPMMPMSATKYTVAMNTVVRSQVDGVTLRTVAA